MHGHEQMAVWTSNMETFLQDFLEAKASELVENLDEMVQQYYVHSDVFSRFKFPTTHQFVIRNERVI